MPSIASTANYSFYAIPAFFVLIQTPKVYAHLLIRDAMNGKVENVNPRGEDNAQLLKKTLPRDKLAKYERAMAAHANGIENFSLLAAAVIGGNMARLDPSTLNTVSGVFLALRVAYNVAYIHTTTRPWSGLRSGIWISSVGCCLYVQFRVLRTVFRVLAHVSGPQSFMSLLRQFCNSVVIAELGDTDHENCTGICSAKQQA